MNPDYSKYSILELEDILNNIDKHTYADRYQAAKSEYLKKLNDPKQVALEQKAESIKSKDNKLTAQFTISSVIIIFFTARIIDALYSGTIRFKTGPLVDLAIDPKGFYFILFWHAAFAIFGLCIFCKNLNNETV